MALLAATVVRGALTIIFCILLFALVIAFVAFSAARPENAMKVMEMTDIVPVFEDAQIAEAIAYGLESVGVIDANVGIEIVSEFLRRDNVSGAFAKVAEGYANAIAEGDYDYYLGSGDIVDIIKAVAPDLYDEFGASLTNADYDIIAETIDRYVDLSSLSVGNVLDAAGVDAKVPYILLSNYPPTVISLLGILLVFNIFLLHRKRIRTAFLAVGFSFALSGLACFVAGSLLGSYSESLSGTFFSVAMPLIAGATGLLVSHGLLFLAAGVISLTVSAVIRISRNQYVPENSGIVGTAVWRIAGLVANVSVLTVCYAMSMRFYSNMPQ